MKKLILFAVILINLCACDTNNHSEHSNNISVKENNNYSIELFNSNGQLMMQQIMDTNNISISMREFNQGLYLLKISTDGGAITKRVVKQ